MVEQQFLNPFRPGAGHRPPYLAGRGEEISEFRKLLAQGTITDNMVLTGLRGVGKTVLVEELKPIALASGWLWVGTDLSEAASISEANLANRILTDLSVVTGSMKIGVQTKAGMGFGAEAQKNEIMLGYNALAKIFEETPGLVVDRLKAVFLFVAPIVRDAGRKGVVFAYDEAQNLSDHAAKDQFPLSLLLDLFQSVQRQGIPFMLLLVGLPTLFPKLVDARTYAERMFRVLFLRQLSEPESLEAISRPVADANCPVRFGDSEISLIYRNSGGYPYFIQFICREAFDAYIQRTADGKPRPIPIAEIIRKLDSDFFAGRWARITDRQQELMLVIANLDDPEDEFTVQEILTKSAIVLKKPFGRSHINQLLASLIAAGLIYRDRHGKYLFAVPLMASFIKRVMAS